MLLTIYFFFCYLLCLVILCKGRVSLELLSRSNNLETQMFLWTLTSSRVAGDSDFTEGEGLSWTWTDQNSSFKTIPSSLNFHGPLLQYISFVLVPCGTGRREAGIRSMKDEVGIPHLQYKPHLCQAPALTAGQWQLCHLPLSKRMAGYKPPQNTWQQSDPVFNACQRKKLRHTAFTFRTCLCHSSPTRKHHISKPRQWQTAKCRFSTFCNISWLAHQHNGTPPLRKRFWLPRSIYSQRWRELPFSPLTKLSRSSQDRQQASVRFLQICRVCFLFLHVWFALNLTYIRLIYHSHTV